MTHCGNVSIWALELRDTGRSPDAVTITRE
jgi:hypothetical protein